jgi:hypothetical protein
MNPRIFSSSSPSPCSSSVNHHRNPNSGHVLSPSLEAVPSSAVMLQRSASMPRTFWKDESRRGCLHRPEFVVSFSQTSLELIKLVSTPAFPKLYEHPVVTTVSLLTSRALPRIIWSPVALFRRSLSCAAAVKLAGAISGDCFLVVLVPLSLCRSSGSNATIRASRGSQYRRLRRTPPVRCLQSTCWLSRCPRGNWPGRVPPVSDSG